MKTINTNQSKLSLYSRFIQSEQIIKYHLQHQFPLSLLLVHQIRYLHIISFVLLLFIGEPMHITYTCIMYLHSFNLLYLGFLNIYIMCYCNTPTTEFLLQGVKTAAYFAGGAYMGHNALSVYFLPPNLVSNTYHIYSPTGRGYGAYSCSQLIAVDALKGAQGEDFEVASIVNKHKMLDNSLIAKQFEKTSTLPTLNAFLKGRNS